VIRPVEDVQANTQDELVALPSDQIEYEHIRWGEPNHTKVLLAPRCPKFLPSLPGTTHDGWENADGAFGEFTLDTTPARLPRL